ncbi:uncharacterized protein LOC143921169 [Arctopsyche grandis]|uniref:uncharacterized protein LOC143921169 n=1 Tax=Arctopsyche grandis TaxID=121162 RepID=UPI00406D8EE2
MKERASDREWEKNWGFFKNHRHFIAEEAFRKGISTEEYQSAVESMKKHPLQKKNVSISSEDVWSLPKTSSGMVGWRCKYKLEEKSPPMIQSPPVPIKQNVIFLG